MEDLDSWTEGYIGGTKDFYAKRLGRDMREVFSRDFNCAASSVKVHSDGASIRFIICTHEGPYRRGTFEFTLEVPETYPFHSPIIRSTAPLWHPNISLSTGEVQFPHRWSPVLTLDAAIMSVQLLLLEPSSHNLMNAEAYALHSSDPIGFEHHIQGVLLDSHHHGIYFQCHLCRRSSCLGVSPRSVFHGHNSGDAINHARGHENGMPAHKSVKRKLSDVTEKPCNDFSVESERKRFSAEDDYVYIATDVMANKRLREYLKWWSSDNGSNEIGNDDVGK